MTSSFTCPHNKKVHIVGKCVINECPYHLERVKQFFKLESGDTDCAYYDSDIMQNVSAARTQISALSRDPRRRISPKLIRSTYENACNSGKTLHTLTHDVINDKNCCQRCGYPLSKGISCVSVETCNSRKDWLQYVCSQYQVDASVSKFQLIWSLLLQNELYLPQNSLRIGYSLCYPKDVRNNPSIPTEYINASP